MDTGKIIQLKECWDEMRAVFNGIQKNHSRILQDLDRYTFFLENHKIYYDQFIEELKVNSQRYSRENVRVYLVAYLEDVAMWPGFDLEKKKEVVKHNVLLELSIHLMDAIDYYSKNITALIACDEVGGHLPELEKLIHTAEVAVNPEGNVSVCHPVREERFDIELIRKKLKKIADPFARLELLHNKKHDFKVWLSEFDEVYPQCSKGCQFYSEEFYPNFLRKCTVEIELVEDQIKLEQLKNLTLPVNKDGDKIEDDDGGLIWESSQANFLELSKALFLSQVIKRKDGQELTQKDFFIMFSRFFNMEIKYSHKILNSVANRKSGVVVFLKILHETLVNYYQFAESKRA